MPLELLLLMLTSQKIEIANKVSIDLTHAIPVPEPFALDAALSTSPGGQKIGIDSTSLTINGRRMLMAMGEFQYTRYPASDWKTELLKMKAGGMDIVSTYVFWIHHEEVEGKWVWLGQRNLRRFVDLCGKVGMKVVIRGGPWAHGECRNGGLPDWLVKSTRSRTDDPAYMKQAELFYGQIATQLKGLYWKDGGPVIAFQVENEWGGAGEYLMAFKKMAQEVGIQVPIFTRTGWPSLSSPIPFGEIFPLYGGYPTGFWDRGTQENAPKYGNNFLMTLQRNPDNILQARRQGRRTSEENYPYMCTEIGAGMEVSYHRRVWIEPDDIGSLAMVKLASGNNLQGYYMYHGGTNPEGKLTYLNETQATGYWNDVPVKSYDFQTALGEFGQVRDQYHILRRMHLFMQDFGAELAAMPATLPSVKPSGQADNSTLRWSVRSDGQSGFIFVNNFQRLQSMPVKEHVQFELNLPSGVQTVPPDPVDIPADSYFYWPFNLSMNGVTLQYATAQPICKITEGKDVSYFFAETKRVAPQFLFDHHGMRFSTPGVTTLDFGTGQLALRPSPKLSPAVIFEGSDHSTVSVFLLGEADSLRLWKGELGGKERVVISHDNVQFDGGNLHLSNEKGLVGELAIFPAPDSATAFGKKLDRTSDTFPAYRFQPVESPSADVVIEVNASPGKPRKISMGSQGVAEQPLDRDFDSAGVWRLRLPGDAAKLADPILRIAYQGDVARLYLDGKLIEDNFWNGKPLDLGLKRFGPAIFHGKLELKVLPLAANAPIYLPPNTHPFAKGQSSVCEVMSAQVISKPSVTIKVR